MIMSLQAWVLQDLDFVRSRALVGRRLLPKSARQLSKRFYRGKPLLPQMSVISSARWPWLLHQTSSSSEFLACVMCAPPLWTAWRHSLIMLIDLRVSLWEGYGPGSRPQQMIMYGGRWAGSGGSLRRRTAAMLPQAAGGGCAPVAGSGSGRRAARGVGQPVGWKQETSYFSLRGPSCPEGVWFFQTLLGAYR